MEAVTTFRASSAFSVNNMNTCSLMFIVPALFWALETPKKTAKDQLQGTWRVVATEFDGRTLPEAEIKGRHITFLEDKFKVVTGGVTRRTLTFRLEEGKAPKHIDITNPDKNETANGIYVLEKDELKLCYGEPGEKRPSEFASPAGMRLFLITLKREKP